MKSMDGRAHVVVSKSIGCVDIVGLKMDTIAPSQQSDALKEREIYKADTIKALKGSTNKWP
jgi:hypothetical protein